MLIPNYSTRWHIAQIWFAGIAVSLACGAVLGAIPSVGTIGAFIVLAVLPAAMVLTLRSDEGTPAPVSAE